MATNTSTLARHYELLEGPERFVAVIEAMARQDSEEEARLDDACPRSVYEVDDPTYRRRMSMSCTTAQLACTSMLRDLEVLKMIEAAQEVIEVFRPMAGGTTEMAFFTGWHVATAQGSDGLDQMVQQMKEQEATDEAARRRFLDRSVLDEPMNQLLSELQEQAMGGMDRIATFLKTCIGRHRCRSLLSTWDGFSRFCRECVQVEPLVLIKAWRLTSEDPAQVAREMYPEVTVDAEQAQGWYESLTQAWQRHTPEPFRAQA